MGFASVGFIIEGSRVVGNTAATLAGGIYVQVPCIQRYLYNDFIITIRAYTYVFTFQTDSTLRLAFTTVEGNRANDGAGGPKTNGSLPSSAAVV